MTVIGLGGKLRSGKDAIADHLVAEHGFVKIGMSDALHEAMLAIDPIVGAIGKYGPTSEADTWRYSDLIAEIGYVEAKTKPEVRRLLQQLGTEVGRNMMGENVWADIMARKVREHAANGRHVVVTGLRFENEIEAIHRAGGFTWWVLRPLADAPSAGAAAHSSENSVGRNDFGFAIHNDGTLEDLGHSVDALLYALTGRGRSVGDLIDPLAGREVAA